MKTHVLVGAAVSALVLSTGALVAPAYAASASAAAAHGRAGAAGAGAAGAVRSSSSTVYVAPRGSDSASGTLAAPFATIQHAVAALPGGGGTVVVRGGTYAQRFSLHGVTNVTVAAAAGEHPVLDGSTLKVPTGRSAVVDIADSTSVAVRGLEITGYRTSDIAAMPIGIYVHGGDTGVTISGDHVHTMGNDNGTLGSMDMNAHGIAAYGDSPTRSISGLTIDGNEVDHLKLGASESVVVNGNVDGWRITGNHIHDNNNIGIDAIGFEPTLPAKYRYTDLNRARNGVIRGNDVESIISEGNPAYWSSDGWCNCADGLYVDGGTHIDIAGNTVRTDDIGIEVAAENARGAADHVTVEGNAVSDSRYVGITTGGYCDGGEDCGGVQTGTSFANTFTGNVLRNNNTDHDGSPEFLVQFHESGNRITGNTICAAGPGITLIGTVARSTSGQGDVVDGNRYSAAAADATSAHWGWHGTTYTGFAAYRAATGLDAHSVFSAGC